MTCGTYSCAPLHRKKLSPSPGHFYWLYLMFQGSKMAFCGSHNDTQGYISEVSLSPKRKSNKFIGREEPRWQSRRTCSHSLLREHQNHN